MYDPPFRVTPALPPQAMKSYRIIAPSATHFRPATCEEVDCIPYREGWRLRVEGLPPEMLHTARTCGRKFTELRVAEGETYLVYEAGQPCFKASQHMVPNGRPERFIERDGDWRGNPTGRRIMHSVTGWVDSFGENQERLREAQERG